MKIKEDFPRISIFETFLPVVVLVVILAANVALFDDTLSGPNQVALIVAMMVAVVIGAVRKVPFAAMMQRISSNIGSTASAIVILLFIGTISGTWLLSGVIPSMIYYGLMILSPVIFLVATVVICALVSISTGSSWATVATIGVALIGIGDALGFSAGVTAGAIISGAYFGDKMSPMSDTTNLAAAMAQVDIVKHIKYMLYTTVPAIVITLILFLGIGFLGDNSAEIDTSQMMGDLDGIFNINPFLLMVPATVIILIIKKMPAIPALAVGSFLGLIVAAAFQGELISELLSGSSSVVDKYKLFIDTITSGVSIPTENPTLERLLQSGGMAGMLNTVWLIITAMAFGGVMESIGALQKISELLMRFTTSTGGIVTATAGTCVSLNILVSDQYLSILIPGRMFAQVYDEKGLDRLNLSRTLEDSATVTSVLIPWNTCGLTQATVLKVATLTYAPWAFFCYLSPLMTITFAWMKIKIKRADN